MQWTLKVVTLLFRFLGCPVALHLELAAGAILYGSFDVDFFSLFETGKIGRGCTLVVKFALPAGLSMDISGAVLKGAHTSMLSVVFVSAVQVLIIE